MVHSGNARRCTGACFAQSTRGMRMYVLTCLALQLLFGVWNEVTGSTVASIGHYRIETFIQKSRILENDIIKGCLDTVLTPVDVSQGVACRPGELLYRKKMSSGKYALHRGILDTSVFNGDLPLYIFTFPHWARLEDMVHYRMYRFATERIGADEAAVYFDNERLYSQTTSELHYFRNGVWFTLTGTLKKPFGTLSVTSTPSGAEVVLNGTTTVKKTPCVFHNLIGGVYSVGLSLEEHQFFRRTVRIVPDSGVTASFELIKDIDTVFITGDAQYSLLLLPKPPLDLPYIINDSITLYGTRIRIPSGMHSIKWNDDEGKYISLDTLITVEEKRVLYFDYLFELRYGILRLLPTPFDADVCIDRFGCSPGERVEELPVGIYRIDAYRQGFSAFTADVHVYPDTVITLSMDLSQVPDSDGDGYPDSSDHCPEVYGLYSGCTFPKFRPVLSSMVNELKAFSEEDKFTFGVSLVGFVSKTPTNRTFREFLSVFSDGKNGGVNNYKGVTALNSIECTWRGFYCNAELGQWSSGIRYQRSDTLFLEEQGYFYYDSLFGVEPVLYIPSTSVSLGVHYTRYWVDISYSVGFHWEDIVINQLFDVEEQVFKNVTFNNDWWYHQLGFDVDFRGGDQYVPSIYIRMKYPFGRVRQTRWTVLNAGLQLKIATGKGKDEKMFTSKR